MGVAVKIGLVINGIILKITHFLIATFFWTSGLLQSILSAICSLTMSSMLKGSEINGFNLTQSPNHVAVIVSNDWTSSLGETAAVLKLCQLTAWLILSGVTFVTIYDHKNDLKLSHNRVIKFLARYFDMQIRLEDIESKVFLRKNSQFYYPDQMKRAIEAPLNGMVFEKRMENIKGMNEPELAIVLDPKNKKEIFGFDPWGIRLTEFTFWKDISQSNFETSLKSYSKVQKRFGK